MVKTSTLLIAFSLLGFIGATAGLVIRAAAIEGLTGPPDEPVFEIPGDARRNCAPAVFVDESGEGSAVLQVRGGPGSNYRVRESLTHGDTFLVFEYRGDWAGIVFGHNREVCGAQARRQVSAPRQGWIPAAGITYLPG